MISHTMHTTKPKQHLRMATIQYEPFVNLHKTTGASDESIVIPLRASSAPTNKTYCGIWISQQLFVYILHLRKPRWRSL